MTYSVVGLMSGSSLDGLDIAFIEFEENGGKWNFDIVKYACIAYTPQMKASLQQAPGMSAIDYLLLHTQYGRLIGQEVNRFIEENKLDHRVQLVASHGHTVFHLPAKNMTAQLGDGATIAAVTGINVVSDLRAVDIAFGGQGAPIVPIGEKLLFSQYHFCLNLGGIANISSHVNDNFIAFDICAANRILDVLVAKLGKYYDDNGNVAATGNLAPDLLIALNDLEYYRQPYPKSLDNSFGLNLVVPLINGFGLETADALHTYVEHIAYQLALACKPFATDNTPRRMLVTGGGAHNTYMVQKITEYLKPLHLQVEVPDKIIVNYKEALIMALIGLLRWREEYNVLSSVTGASRDSINGAVWMGQEA